MCVFSAEHLVKVAGKTVIGVDVMIKVKFIVSEHCETVLSF